MSREQSKRTISCPPKCFARRRMIAGMGTSPAVLTETVWALAHQHDIIAAKGKAWSGVFS
jgi:hypothetical protein